ncbi:MAG: cellulase [Phycisphaerales bacterium]|nr:cellulase [Phycisphaerales bacterium]
MKLDHPLAITMWDFSWLERRWPGAGYENWSQALDELVQRGYDAVRIDAYPHLHAAGATQQHTIIPCWNQQHWGSPAKTRVTIQPHLNDFLRLCQDRKIRVALSSWYQNDEQERRLMIANARVHAQQWAGVLDTIAADGLLDTILYVDLCNEWPLDVWAPYFLSAPTERQFESAASCRWMTSAIESLRSRYSQLDYCFSYTGAVPPQLNPADCLNKVFDFFEPHIWMVCCNNSEFYQRVDYHYPRFDDSGFRKMVDRAEPLYRSDPTYWQNLLQQSIESYADWSNRVKLPLITTECWGVVDYKDWPLLNWDWVKELCELGVRTAAATGRWAAIATSNFCGPQFVGMWRDIDWHRRLTDLIHESALPQEVRM